jgi:hypothetical protein
MIPEPAGIVILVNKEKFGELISIEPPVLSPDVIDSYITHILPVNIDFTFTVTPDENNEKVFNYLTTVPEEWDLFIRQCLEKYAKA